MQILYTLLLWFAFFFDKISGNGIKKRHLTAVTLVTDEAGNYGTDELRFLDVGYPHNVYTMYEDTRKYKFYGYRFSWETNNGNNYIDMKFSDSGNDLSLLGDGKHLGQYINVELDGSTHFLRSKFGKTGYWCKVCSSTMDDDAYKDSCWAILPSTDHNRTNGCNSVMWVGTGIYYGGFNCNGCHAGGFAGYKSNLEAKGSLPSLGLNISILFEKLPNSGLCMSISILYLEPLFLYNFF